MSMRIVSFDARNPIARRMTSVVAVAWVGALLLPLVAGGCGGGAKEEPEVVRKPSKTTGGGTTSGETTSGTKKTSGTAATGFGTLKGRVILTGMPPSLAPLVTKGAEVKDAAVCAANDIPDESLVVSADGGVANVFLYMDRAPAGGKDTAAHEAESYEFDQKQCIFVPHAMVVRVGRPIDFKNSDPISHNVHTLSRRNDEFNRVLGQEVVQYAYPKAEREPIRVKCDFHAWMSAYHLPLDHPYGVVTGADGSFEMHDLPAGEHTLRIWHEKAGTLDRRYTVQIKAGETTEVEISYAASRFARFEGPKPKTIYLSSLQP